MTARGWILASSVVIIVVVSAKMVSDKRKPAKPDEIDKNKQLQDLLARIDSATK